MEISVVAKFSERVQTAKILTEVEWDNDPYEHMDYGKAVVRVLEDFEYTHPSGRSSVRLRKGSCITFFLQEYNNRACARHYISIDDAVGQEDWSNCMGYDNPTVLVNGDKDEAVRLLIDKGLNRILFNAVNYDGNDSDVLTPIEAEEHYEHFGMEYLSHAFERW